MPGVGEGAAGAALGQAARDGARGGGAQCGVRAWSAPQATVESVALQAGRAAARPTWPRSVPKAQVQKADNVAQQAGSRTR